MVDSQFEKTPEANFILNQDLVITDDNGLERIRLEHETGEVTVRNSSQQAVFQWEMSDNNLKFGGQSRGGELFIFPNAATNLSNTEQSTFHFNGQQGLLRLGGGQIAGQDPIPGRLVFSGDQNNQTIFLNGASGEVAIGANGQNGNLVLQKSDNEISKFIFLFNLVVEI